MTEYLTPASAGAASLVEKKSEFIALVAPVPGEAEAMACLEQVREQHRTAGHHVWAYRLLQGQRERCSDDGEPAKTAGPPVLSVLAGASLLNCIAVVTRYFGGTLLGTGGLVRAYSGAAAAALRAAGIARVAPLVRLSLSLPYPLYSPAARLLADAGAAVENTDFAEAVRITAVMPQSAAPALAATLTELLRGGPGLSISPPFHATWPHPKSPG